MTYKRLIPLIFIFLVITFIFAMEDVNRRGTGESILIYGGSLPGKTVTMLSEMNSHLENAVHIVHATRGMIRLTDQDNIVREYYLKNGMLWADQNPVLDGISFLHFEYRDKYGNLMTRPVMKIEEIKVIAYTMKLGLKTNKVFTRFRTTRPALSEEKTSQLAMSDF